MLYMLHSMYTSMVTYTQTYTRARTHTHTHTKYLLRATVPYVSFHTFRPPYCHVTSYCNVMLHHIILSDHRTVTLHHIMLSPLAQHTVT